MYGEKQKKTLLLTGDSINNSMEKTHTDDLYSRINLEKTIRQKQQQQRLIAFCRFRFPDAV